MVQSTKALEPVKKAVLYTIKEVGGGRALHEVGPVSQQFAKNAVAHNSKNFFVLEGTSFSEVNDIFVKAK